MTDLARRLDRTDIVRQQFAPNATDEDLVYFATVARHLGLDPWAGHICLIPYRGVHRPQVTVAGRRAIAARTGRLRGIEGPVWCGPRAANGGELRWLEVWDDDDSYPYAARCLVWPAEWTTPANGTVKWSEFAQHDKNDQLLPTWRNMPSHMLGKVAESLALRRGFPEVETAVEYTGGDDDTATIAEAAAPSVGPAPAAAPAAAVGPAPARTTRRDEVPEWVYDNTPEARGYRG